MRPRRRVGTRAERLGGGDAVEAQEGVEGPGGAQAGGLDAVAVEAAQHLRLQQGGEVQAAQVEEDAREAEGGERGGEAAGARGRAGSAAQGAGVGGDEQVAVGEAHADRSIVGAEPLAQEVAHRRRGARDLRGDPPVAGPHHELAARPELGQGPLDGAGAGELAGLVLPGLGHASGLRDDLGLLARGGPGRVAVGASVEAGEHGVDPELAAAREQQPGLEDIRRIDPLEVREHDGGGGVGVARVEAEHADRGVGAPGVVLAEPRQQGAQLDGREVAVAEGQQRRVDVLRGASHICIERERGGGVGVEREADETCLFDQVAKDPVDQARQLVRAGSRSPEPDHPRRADQRPQACEVSLRGRGVVAGGLEPALAQRGAQVLRRRGREAGGAGGEQEEQREARHAVAIYTLARVAGGGDPWQARRVPVTARYRPDPRYLELGDGFADVVAAAKFPRHVLRLRNDRWAARVGLDGLTDDEWAAHFAGFAALPGNLPRPLALRYHGHQFGAYNPGLGDGRGFLFAQLRDDADRLLDLGTKGSGQTPYARGGDGRLTLKGGAREVLASEQLEALGVDTCKTFSLFETGERLHRGDEPSPTRSSVLVRLSHSHVRFGTFQRLAHLREHARLARLVDHVVAYYHPQARREDPVATTAELLRAVARRAADTVAGWMVAGFVHGVLNTDNMNITGESFDYGPWRFVPTFDLEFVAAYFDETGLYAYGRQPQAVLWNLERLAEALLPLAPKEPLLAALQDYGPAYAEALCRRFLARLGLRSRGAGPDEALVDAAYAFMHRSQVGHDRFFFDWYGGEASAVRALAGPESGCYGATGPAGAAFAGLRAAWAAYEPAAPERLADPYYAGAGPCSLLVEEVEAIWAAIAGQDDWGPLHAKVAEIRRFGALHGHGPALLSG